MSLRDPIAAAIVFLFGASIFVVAGSYAPAAALFPRAVSAIMMASAVAMGVRAFFGRAQAFEAIDRQAMLRVGMVIGLSLLYVAGVAWLGYATASIVFIPVTAWLLGIRKIGLIAVTTVVFVGIITLLFRYIFNIPLPREVVLGLFS